MPVKPIKTANGVVHARLSTQRKILATMRAMWLSMSEYRNTEESEMPPAAPTR